MVIIMKNKIGLFDSGLGGLSILKGLINKLPNEDYLFYEDSINNPYGEKKEEEIFEISCNIVDYLLKNKCKLIVIACNTATTSCLKKLRLKYPQTIFVGCVPAIKVATDSNHKNILVLATPYTIKSKRVKELISDNKHKDQTINLVSGENLANLVEKKNTEEINKLLTNILKDYQEIDSIVLGCTHYSLIKKEIRRIMTNVDLLDGCQGVANEVKRQLTDNNLLNTSQTKGSVEIINSKNAKLITRSYEFLND